MNQSGFFTKGKSTIRLFWAASTILELLLIGAANLCAETHPVPVDDLTASLTVEAATLGQDSTGQTELAVTIRNSGTKPVSAYTISFGEVSVTQPICAICFFQTSSGQRH